MWLTLLGVLTVLVGIWGTYNRQRTLVDVAGVPCWSWKELEKSVYWESGSIVLSFFMYWVFDPMLLWRRMHLQGPKLYHCPDTAVEGAFLWDLLFQSLPRTSSKTWLSFKRKHRMSVIGFSWLYLKHERKIDTVAIFVRSPSHLNTRKLPLTSQLADYKTCDCSDASADTMESLFVISASKCLPLNYSIFSPWKTLFNARVTSRMQIAKK